MCAAQNIDARWASETILAHVAYSSNVLSSIIVCVLCCTDINVTYITLICRMQQKCDLYSATWPCHCHMTRQKIDCHESNRHNA